MQDLVLVRIPSPQVLEQLVNDVHFDSPPFTEQKREAE